MMIVCTYTSSWQIRELLQSDLVFYEVDTMMQLAASPIYHAFPLWGLFAADADGYWWFSEVMSEWSGGNITACSAQNNNNLCRNKTIYFIDGLRHWGWKK